MSVSTAARRAPVTRRPGSQSARSSASLWPSSAQSEAPQAPLGATGRRGPEVGPGRFFFNGIVVIAVGAVVVVNTIEEVCARRVRPPPPRAGTSF